MFMESKVFEVVLLGVIFDPATRKILIGKRENDKKNPKLGWCFPGGRLIQGEDEDKRLKRKIKEKTGYDVKNLGAIFTRVPPERKDMILMYFLCEVFKGKLKAGDDLKTLKWVEPDKLEGYFTTSFHPRLREYILNLK
jgi:ADP-ribose pyrophosphatase YjhB (NUDIX family)